MGPVVQSKNGNNYILVVQDYFTKFVEAYGIPDQTAQTVADCLVTSGFVCMEYHWSSTLIKAGILNQSCLKRFANC